MERKRDRAPTRAEVQEACDVLRRLAKLWPWADKEGRGEIADAHELLEVLLDEDLKLKAKDDGAGLR